MAYRINKSALISNKTGIIRNNKAHKIKVHLLITKGALLFLFFAVSRNYILKIV